MKRFIALLVIGLLIVLNTCAFATFSSSIETKSKLFQDWLVTGVFGNVTNSDEVITTGIDYIKAYGVVVTQETTDIVITTVEGTGASTTEVNGTGVKAKVSGGDIIIVANQGSTEASRQPDGTWWVIGK